MRKQKNQLQSFQRAFFVDWKLGVPVSYTHLALSEGQGSAFANRYAVYEKGKAAHATALRPFPLLMILIEQ